jgi:hypothetical protein
MTTITNEDCMEQMAAHVKYCRRYEEKTKTKKPKAETLKKNGYTVLSVKCCRVCCYNGQLCVEDALTCERITATPPYYSENVVDEFGYCEKYKERKK